MKLEQQVLSPGMCRGALRLQEPHMEQGRGVRGYRPHWGLIVWDNHPKKFHIPTFSFL